MRGNPFYGLERQQAAARNRAQAQARPARVRFFIRCTPGEARLAGDKALRFPTHFLDEPTVAIGMKLNRMPALGNIPMAVCFVTNYIVNEQGLYTAAEVAMRLDSDVDTLHVKFSVTFEGTALPAPVMT